MKSKRKFISLQMIINSLLIVLYIQWYIKIDYMKILLMFFLGEKVINTDDEELKMRINMINNEVCPFLMNFSKVFPA